MTQAKRLITLTTLATEAERDEVDQIATENQISRAAAIRFLIKEGLTAFRNR